MRVGILGLGLMGGLSEIRKPQVKSYEVQISGFAKDTDRGANGTRLRLPLTGLMPAISISHSTTW